MFDHFHVQNHVEHFSGFGKLFSGGGAVINGQTLPFGMNPRHPDVAFGCIRTDHIRAQPRHRLRKQSAAATDVQNTKPFKRPFLSQIAPEFRRDLRRDIVKPAGVQHVKWPEFTIRIPPLGGHALELRDFPCIDGLGHLGSLWGMISLCPIAGSDITGYRTSMDRVPDRQKISRYLLYPPLEPFDQRMMDVGDGHRVYVEQCGNRNGVPVLVLHGGPGGGCSPAMRRYFDPEFYRTVLFDQRGCGRSHPHASVEANTTWHLVRDIESIRIALGIEKWIVFGGSWGAALALIYAQTNPERAVRLVLRGVFLMTRAELDWFYGGGAGLFWPELWERFVKPIPENERHDLIAAYGKRLFSGDLMLETRYARNWATWENTLASIGSEGPGGESPAEFARAFARLENHYFSNVGFLEEEDQIINGMGRISHIAGVIVQGRYDLICPPYSAYRLHRAWTGSDLRIIGRAGHALSEPGIGAELVRVMDRYRRDPAILSLGE